MQPKRAPQCGAPAWIPAFAGMTVFRPSLDAFHLLELELDRGRAAEDGDGDLHAALLEIELLDDAVEAGEGAVEHLDRVADLIIDADPGFRRGGGGLVLGVEDARGLGIGDGLRLAA